MILFKIVLVFCGVALTLAAAGDLTIYLLLRINSGGIGIAFNDAKDFNRIPMLVLSALWVLSILLGWIIAKKLHLIPQL